jgi:hypothetical protein
MKNGSSRKSMEDGEKDKSVFVCNKSCKNAQQKYIKQLPGL